MRGLHREHEARINLPGVGLGEAATLLDKRVQVHGAAPWWA
jgi:hypothetical protein